MRLFLPAFFEDLFAALDLNLTGAQCRLLCLPVVLGVLRPGEVLDELPDEFLGKLHDDCQKAWNETKKAAQ